MSGIREGIQMLCEVADKFEEARMKRGGQDLSRGQKCSLSGRETKNVIRAHLLSQHFNVSNVNVYIVEDPRARKKVKVNLLLLKEGVDQTRKEYTPAEIHTVFQIINTAVGNRTRTIRAKFREARALSKKLRFACIVLSERVDYIHKVTTKKLGDPVFTLVSRSLRRDDWIEWRNKIRDRYRKGALRETSEWNRLIDYLSSNAHR